MIKKRILITIALASAFGKGAWAESVTFNVRSWDETSGIVDTETNSSPSNVNSSLSEWYDMQGRRLSGKPTARGIYIHNGRKIVVMFSE